MADTNDDKLLASMLENAEKLCKCGDALLMGQYAFLRERIRALMELRMADDATETP
jgi:hypothetical protein